MKQVGIFLILAALIAGMAGCGPAVRYNLTISSTEGGQVTEPGEGTFAYNQGTAVDLIAEAEQGYYFVEWTGDVSAVADVHDETTTITMDGDYSITANFATVAEIWDWYDLDAVRDNLSGNYTLMNDIDSTTSGYDELASPTANEGKGWQPIGSTAEEDAFVGSFDGQGHEIRDLFINRPNENIVGLFVGVLGAGVVENIGVVDAYVVGDSNTGVLAGANTGTITNSYATGTVAGNWSVGGLVGGNGGDGTVSYCYFNGSVTGYVYVGCLVGFNSYAVVSNSYSTGSATGAGAVGGLVGVNERGYVSNSYSIGSADGGGIIGGLVGANAGNVSESYSLASVTGNGYVGGLVGHNGWNVTNCYSAGSVAGNDDVGGLVGEGGYDHVTDSFWDTETSGQPTSAGGTGKNTTEMQDIVTFSSAGWDITAVALNETNPAYIWNIVDDETYPFLSWEPIS